MSFEALEALDYELSREEVGTHRRAELLHEIATYELTLLQAQEDGDCIQYVRAKDVQVSEGAAWAATALLFPDRKFTDHTEAAYAHQDAAKPEEEVDPVPRERQR